MMALRLKQETTMSLKTQHLRKGIEGKIRNPLANSQGSDFVSEGRLQVSIVRTYACISPPLRFREHGPI